MFPINFNFPYRKKDGSLITMEKALDGAGSDLDLVDLDDVAITDPANGDLLQYNSSTHKWESSGALTEQVTDNASDISDLQEDVTVTEIDPADLSSANARISLESTDNIIIRKIGRLVIIEKLGIVISAGADIPYNAGALITGLPAPESAKCVLVATGNAYADFKSVGFTVNASGSLIPASFNNIPANANNQAAYFIGGASYIAKE